MKNLRYLYYMNILLLLGGIICLASGYILDFKIFREIFSRPQMRIIKQIHIWSGYFFTIFLIWHMIGKLPWFNIIAQKIK